MITIINFLICVLKFTNKLHVVVKIRLDKNELSAIKNKY